MKMPFRVLLSFTLLTGLWLAFSPPTEAQSRKRSKKTETRVRKKSRQPERTRRPERTTRTSRKRHRTDRVANAEKPQTNRPERRRETPPEPKPATTAAAAPTTARSETRTDRRNAVTDKRVGWDDKGRPLYEETGGKRYYVNASGSKVYATKNP